MEFGPRIMILGAPGSGKSTLARRLGVLTGLPVFHMDQIHWQPGWVQRATADRLAMAHEVEDGARWVFEGGLSATYPHRVARASAAVWLDLPLSLRLWRVGWRAWRHRGETRPDLAPDCPEQFGPMTLELMRYMIRSRREGWERISAALAARPDLPLWHLISRRAVGDFLAQAELASTELTAAGPR